MTAPPAGPRGRLAQWAAVLLPVVFGLRALLLVFQLSGEHHSRKPVVLAWPLAPGERLPFEGGNAGIRAWAAQAEHPAIPAMLIDKNGERMPAGTGYMLNPEAMAGLVGGRLTLQSQDADGYCTARWSWAVTMPTLAASDAGRGGTAAQRQVEAAMLDTADCGMLAHLQLTRPALHRLVTILNNRSPTP